ncbi:oxidoreductase domain containing protein [Gracilaria domingensis]|nr:oxidoreductase domain containing protein [Gracilaria domingensis]
MGGQVIKLGLLSTANINIVILDGVARLDGVECTTIASRDKKRAQRYAEQHKLEHACTYEEIVTAPIDAVYIPLPTAIASEWAVRCANAGKHVFVDKPFVSTPEVEAIKEACEQAQVIFMDATHFVHSNRTKQVRQRIVDGDVGTVKRLQSTFCIPMPNVAQNIRSNPELEPLTMWGDLGWYASRAAVAFLGVDATENILSVHCTSKTLKRFPRVLESIEGVVEFGTCDEDKVYLCFIIDCAASRLNRTTIIGEEGYLEIDGFVAPPRQSKFLESIRKPEDYCEDTDYTYERSVTEIKGDDNYQWSFPAPEQVHVDEGGLPQYAQMVKEYVRMIRENDMEASAKWMTETLATQRIVDTVFEKIREQHGWK